MILRTCLIILGIFVLTSCETNNGGSFSGESPTIGDGIDGVNGSYTALVSVDNRLYYVDGEFLYTNDITDPTNMVLINKQNIGNNIETLFYRNNLIFIGSGPALYIYELDDEGIPFRISETRYDSFADDMVPCDPVIADEKFAYVTLSSTPITVQQDGGCPRTELVNELRIYNIENLKSPMLTSVTSLFKPKGLAIDGAHLFVCDSEEGLKVFDITNRESPQLIHHFEDITTYDVIASNGLLVVTGPSAIVEYDYSDINTMTKIGTFNL